MFKSYFLSAYTIYPKIKSVKIPEIWQYFHLTTQKWIFVNFISSVEVHLKS
jgi:hypothetical protein